MSGRSKAGSSLWALAGPAILAYVMCAVHDDYRLRSGEPDKCILPAVRAFLMQILGL